MRVPHALLRDTISVEDYDGSGAMGPTFAAAREVRASVQETEQLIADGQGRVVTTVVKAIIRPEAGPIAPESRVTYGGETYRVVGAYPVPDERRPTQWELTLSKWSTA